MPAGAVLGIVTVLLPDAETDADELDDDREPEDDPDTELELETGFARLLR